MGYDKNFIFLIFFFITGLTCIGCSNFEEHIRRNQSEALDVTTARYDAIIVDIEKCIGENKEELRKLLGEPSRIISPSSWEDIEYDEEWVYEKGIPLFNKQYRMFYIKNDIVTHVEFGGIF